MKQDKKSWPRHLCLCLGLTLALPAIAAASDLTRVDTAHPSERAKQLDVSELFRFTQNNVRACEKNPRGQVKVLLFGRYGRDYDRFTERNVGKRVRIKLSALELGQYIVEEPSHKGLIVLDDATGYEKMMLSFCLGGSKRYRRIN